MLIKNPLAQIEVEILFCKKSIFLLTMQSDQRKLLQWLTKNDFSQKRLKRIAGNSS